LDLVHLQNYISQFISAESLFSKTYDLIPLKEIVKQYYCKDIIFLLGFENLIGK
jgi:hypothetical protein